MELLERRFQIALTATAADGPIPIGDVIGAGIVAGAAVYDLTQSIYVTYPLNNPATGQIYAGRSSGYGNPVSIMMNRFYGHHMRKAGFGDPDLDRAAQGLMGYSAIRGREQMIVDAYSGINSPAVGNSRNPIWPFNPYRSQFLMDAYFLFGP